MNRVELARHLERFTGWGHDTLVHRDPGDTLIVDNWRVLLGSSAVMRRPEATHLVARVYLREVFADGQAAEGCAGATPLVTSALCWQRLNDTLRLWLATRKTSGASPCGLLSRWNCCCEKPWRKFLRYCWLTVVTAGTTCSSSLGNTPRVARYVPSSVSVSEVVNRLQLSLDGFNAELKAFCIKHLETCNGGLHTGNGAFDAAGTDWHATFYLTCDVLTKSLGTDLAYRIGDTEAKVARQLDQGIERRVDDRCQKDHRFSSQRAGRSGSSPSGRRSPSQALVWASRDRRPPCLVPGKREFCTA